MFPIRVTLGALLVAGLFLGVGAALGPDRSSPPALAAGFSDHGGYPRHVRSWDYRAVRAEAQRRYHARLEAERLAELAAQEEVEDQVLATTISNSSGVADWDAIVGCEASGDWAFVGGNPFYFALQFAPGTWLAYGGTQAELDAGVAPSRARLIQVAEAVLAGQGPGAWPNCFRWA